MASQVTAYRVFIASPRGLATERKDFRRVIESYNDQEAVERGAVFLPVGWEMTLGKVGRPQKTINEDVRRCDYFLMLLWNRWGQPTSAAPGGFSSGSEEEFSVAQECYSKGTMKAIVVMFKDVTAAQLRDPGTELQNVLDFRKRLEREKELLYETFDKPAAFRERLRRHLAKWMLVYHGGSAERSATDATARQPPPVTIEAPADAPEAPVSPKVRDAEQLATAGRFTEAEQAFAQVLPAQDLDTLNRFGALLVEKRSYASAVERFSLLRELAESRGHAEWQVSALTNLAGVYEVQHALDKAEEALRSALKIRERTLAPDDPRIAASLNRLAQVLTLQDRLDEAEDLLRRALKIHGLLN